MKQAVTENATKNTPMAILGLRVRVMFRVEVAGRGCRTLCCSKSVFQIDAACSEKIIKWNIAYFGSWLIIRNKQTMPCPIYLSYSVRHCRCRLAFRAHSRCSVCDKYRSTRWRRVHLLDLYISRRIRNGLNQQINREALCKDRLIDVQRTYSYRHRLLRKTTSIFRCCQ